MTTPRKSVLWIGLAVGLQLAVLAAVPASKAYTLATGRTVLLKITPADPYDVMSGYYMTLRYDISAGAPLTDWSKLSDEAPVYVVLAEGSDGCWHAEAMHAEWPAATPDKLVIRGTKHWNSVEFGIESYFVPETMRDEVGDAFRKHRDTAKAEVKVDRFGHAAVVRLIFGDKTYEY